MILLIRPLYESTTTYTYYYSGYLDYTDSLFLNKDSANMKLFNEVLKSYPVEVILFFGHGVKDAMLGQNNIPIIKAGVNDNLLKDKVIISLSCESAAILGFSAIEKGAKCFLGYDENFLFMSKGDNPADDEYAKDFMIVGINPAKEILSGASTSEAYQRTLNLYQKLIDKWANIPTPEASLILSFLIHDRDHFTFIGRDTKIEIKKGQSYVIFESPRLDLALLSIVSLFAFA